LRAAYDDGGFSGATMDRPALQRLLADISAGRVDTIVVYKIDRLTRALADFAKIVEILDARGASFVSVTQQFNTTTSMGRLTLNVLLSFAQFEREVIGEAHPRKTVASRRREANSRDRQVCTGLTAGGGSQERTRLCYSSRDCGRLWGPK
jgi:site-specific DNA recombinase